MIRGPHIWEVVEQATKNIGAFQELFDIPLDCPHTHKCMIRCKHFKNFDANPFQYGQFIGAWGKFPHHDQVAS